MDKKEVEKITMDAIEKALKEEDFCEAMKGLALYLVGYDEGYPDDYLFMSEDNEFIVFYSAVNAVFYTYQKSNRRSLI